MSNAHNIEFEILFRHLSSKNHDFLRSSFQIAHQCYRATCFTEICNYDYTRNNNVQIDGSSNDGSRISRRQISDSHYREGWRRQWQSHLSIVVLRRRSFIYNTCACEFNGMFPSFIKLTISREVHLYWMLLGDHVGEKGIMMDLKFTDAK